jgi:hypothetical protein
MRGWVVGGALLLLGCGYHLAGRPSGLPEEARSVSIRLFQNRTREFGLEVPLRRAIEDEFRRHAVLRVVPEPEGDLVLSGEIKSFITAPVAFSATDEAVQYQGVIQVSLRLVDRASQRVVRETKRLQETQDFGAVSGVVITSSPRFQRDTINARDLANMTNVQLGEARRREATRELLELLARDVYRQAVEDF